MWVYVFCRNSMFHVRASASIEVFVSVYFYFLFFFLSTFYMVNRIISLCSWNIFRIQFRICIVSTVSVILVMLPIGALFYEFPLLLLCLAIVCSREAEKFNYNFRSSLRYTTALGEKRNYKWNSNFVRYIATNAVLQQSNT